LEIVGREREVAAVSSFLEAVERGPRALVLEGQAGVGKSTVWLEGVESARQRGFSVLESRPAAAEARLAFAGVGDLLEGVLPGVIGALPAPQADALRVAMLLARPSGVPPDERAIAVALRGVIRELCVAGRVLLAVDDMQWLDSSSVAVLTFAWRRLRGEPVGLLLAYRAGEPGHRRLPEGQRVERVELGPLSLGAVHRLLHARLGLVLPRPALRRVHETAAGNAFFALELGRAVRRRGMTGSPAEPLRVPERLQELVRERLAALPASTREALGAASASPHAGSATSRSLGRRCTSSFTTPSAHRSKPRCARSSTQDRHRGRQWDGHRRPTERRPATRAGARDRTDGLRRLHPRRTVPRDTSERWVAREAGAPPAALSRTEPSPPPHLMDRSLATWTNRDSRPHGPVDCGPVLVATRSSEPRPHGTGPGATALVS